MNKKCSKCKEEKSLEEFHGLSSPYCKPCRKEYRSTVRQKRASRNNHLSNSYGMTEDDVKMLLDLQDGKCAICLLGLKKPHIDHSYETGHVRGLLCNQCNTGLGMFKDNVDNLIRAMAYVGYSPRGTKFKANPERTSRHRRERQMQLW